MRFVLVKKAEEIQPFFISFYRMPVFSIDTGIIYIPANYYFFVSNSKSFSYISVLPQQIIPI